MHFPTVGADVTDASLSLSCSSSTNVLPDPSFLQLLTPIRRNKAEEKKRKKREKEIPGLESHPESSDKSTMRATKGIISAVDDFFDLDPTNPPYYVSRFRRPVLLVFWFFFLFAFFCVFFWCSLEVCALLGSWANAMSQAKRKTTAPTERLLRMSASLPEGRGVIWTCAANLVSSLGAS